MKNKIYPKGFYKFRKALIPFSVSWVSKKEIRERISKCSKDILKGEKLGKVSSISSGDTKVLVINWGEGSYEIVVTKGYMAKSVNKREVLNYAGNGV